MIEANIMMFAGRCIEKTGYLTVANLQNFIRKQEEVKIAISPEKIQSALDDLVVAGFLNIAVGDENGMIYYVKNPLNKVERKFSEKVQ